MDKVIDTRFDRLEKALANLIDSISKYTPSGTQAGDLVASDKDLSDGLDQLQTHQDNYVRIQKLRQETTDLDAQIKSTITVLWNTRKEITATPTTTYPSSGPKYQFTYSELLDYARRISRTTLPPPGVTNGVDLNAPPSAATALSTQNGEGSSTAQTPAGGAMASGAATPIPGAGSSAESGTGIPSSSYLIGGEHLQASQATTASAATALPDHMLPAVNLLEGAVFYPWPGEDQIRGGALALNQQLRESGVEPRGHDPAEEERRRQEAERERKEVEERQRQQREEHERRMREERERIARERAVAREREDEEARRRGSVAGGAGAAAPHSASPTAASGEKKQFQFMGDLDDDDDD